MKHTASTRSALGAACLLALSMLLAISMLSACSSPNDTPTTTLSVDQKVATNLAPAPTFPAQQTMEEGNFVLVYLIMGGDNGKSGRLVGCNDSVVPVKLKADPNLDPLESAFQALFDLHDPIVNPVGMYDALYQSNLKYEGIEVGQDGQATLHLSGDLVLEGSCDEGRAVAQLEETASQLPGVQKVTILINDQPIGDSLTGQNVSSPTESATRLPPVVNP
jgi:hypothetical protein